MRLTVEVLPQGPEAPAAMPTFAVFVAGTVPAVPAVVAGLRAGHHAGFVLPSLSQLQPPVEASAVLHPLCTFLCRSLFMFGNKRGLPQREHFFLNW